MEKTIAAVQAPRQFGELLQGVIGSGDHVVMERQGEAVAALVPIEVYEQWKRGRRRFFAQASAAAEQAGLAPQEAQALADQAVQAVRAASRP